MLFVSSGLSYGGLNASARTALTGFLAGHGSVGRGTTGAALGSAPGQLKATAVQGNGDANGVVRVVNPGGAVTGGAPDHSFVHAPVWFTDLGPGATVEQSYGAGGPLVSGYWRALEDGTGGPTAAGRASVVAGPNAVLFGTEPLVRDHPKGEFPQVGRALLTVSRPRSVDSGIAVVHLRAHGGVRTPRPGVRTPTCATTVSGCPSRGRAQSLTIILPVLSPRRTPRKASRLFSMPSTTVSRYLRAPEATQGPTSWTNWGWRS